MSLSANIVEQHVRHVVGNDWARVDRVVAAPLATQGIRDVEINTHRLPPENIDLKIFKNLDIFHFTRS